jgi:hypothetical protein
MHPDKKLNRLRRVLTVLGHALQVLREVIYGMTLYEWAHELDKARGEQERLFVVVVYGDLLGIPILPPYYTLRLVPFVVPAIATWRRNLFRERDLTDLFGQEIG